MRRTMGWLLLGGAICLAGVWALSARSVPAVRRAPPSTVPVHTPAIELPQVAAAPAPGEPAAAMPAQPAGPPAPPGITSAEWQQLVAELRGRPDGAAELSRLAFYFDFADTLKRFRSLKQQVGASPDVTALARAVDGGLDARLQQREVTGAEARAIKAQVLEVLLADADVDTRRAELQRWSDAAAPDPAPYAATRARDAEFRRQQAALVAAWSAQAPALRDQRALQRQLAALQSATYPPPAPQTPR